MCTETAAFARGSQGAITAWNPAISHLLSIDTEHALGRQCCDVIAGRDVFGNDFCCGSCTVWRMASTNRPINPYVLSITHDGGRVSDVRVVIVRVRGVTGSELVHLLEPAGSRSAPRRSQRHGSRQEAPCRASSTRLTARELDVTRLLHQGYSTQGIASTLGISTTTVRNHISRSLHKLNAHSRIEAVAVARRLELV